MDTSFKRNYKNCEIEVVVEDDLITTTKVIRDGEVVKFIPLQTKNNADGSAVTPRNIEVAFNIGKAEVDTLFNELLKSFGIEPMVAATEA